MVEWLPLFRLLTERGDAVLWRPVKLLVNLSQSRIPSLVALDLGSSSVTAELHLVICVDEGTAIVVCFHLAEKLIFRKNSTRYIATLSFILWSKILLGMSIILVGVSFASWIQGKTMNK